MRKKVLLIVGIILAGLVIVGLAYWWLTSSSDSQMPSRNEWNTRVVVGSSNAPNKMIEYSDYFCEFCSNFHEQVSSEQFQQKYLDSGLVQLETRIVTVLAGRSPNTPAGAEAAFCAADQDKFVEYTNDIMPRIKRDFFDKGIGVSQPSGYIPIAPVELSYFIESAKAAGLDIATFQTCMETDQHRQEIEENTKRALELGVEGLPSILVNDQTFKGFQDGWQGFELMLKAGGVSVE